MKILLFGKNGQVGWELQRSLSPLGELIALDSSSETLCGDFTDLKGLAETVRSVAPDIIVNAAAHTAVDRAESEPDLARIINATAPSILAEEAKKLNAWLVHYSTDYVFDGSGEKPWIESDPTGPLNVYGKTKLEGEDLIVQSGCHHLIFRTSWVYGATGKNFLLSILRFAREREQLRIVADQHGAPTWSFDLARMTAHVIRHVEGVAAEKRVSLAEAVAPIGGIYHAGGSGETTWFGFASAAVEALRQREPGLKLASIEPIPTSEYPTPAKRPANSRLDCGKLQRVFGYRMMPWTESLAAVMAQV